MIARLRGTLGSNDLEKTMLPQTKGLLDTCLQSARMTLRVLSTLYEHHLLGKPVSGGVSNQQVLLT